MDKKKIKTTFGTATLRRGYYTITSRKEGNYCKKLHRLIYERNFGQIPEGMDIHHKDEDKTNNCIMNLELIEHGAHSSLHNQGENNPIYGKPRSEDTKIKISKTKGSSGIKDVSKVKMKRYKQGFVWRYTYYVKSKRKFIGRATLDDLKQAVIEKGLPWIEF